MEAPLSIAPLTEKAFYERFACAQALTGHQGSVYAIAVGGDGKTCWSWGLDEILYQWHLPSGQSERSITGLKGIQHLKISPDQTLLFVCGWEGPIQAWDLAQAKLYRTYHPSLIDHQDQGAIANAIAVHPQGQWLASGGWDKRVRLWDIHSGECLAAWDGHQSDVNAVTFTHDGQYLISGSWDGTIRCWDLELGDCIRILSSHSQTFDHVAIAADGKSIVGSSKSKALSFWDIERGRCRKTVRGHSKEIIALFISPDSKVAITASWDESVRFWDMETGDCFHQCREHDGRIWTAAFSQDGHTLLTGGQDKLIRVWQSLAPIP
jgi:WD40 repeat protein